MMPKERRRIILDKLGKHEKIDIDQVAQDLNVSAMTIRRDLTYLEEEEQIIRTHGSAILKKPLVIETPFQTKEGKNNLQKRRIAEKAVSYIPEHSSVLLDSGTTTLEIARLLKDRHHLTVVTNDIKIAAELIDSKVKIIVTGGELQTTVGALFGPLTEEVLKTVHVDLSFLGIHAIDLRAGVTAPTFEKASIKRMMIEAAEKTWLVADSSKFDQKSLAKVCDLSSIYGVITDDGLIGEVKRDYDEHLKVISI